MSLVRVDKVSWPKIAGGALGKSHGAFKKLLPTSWIRPVTGLYSVHEIAVPILIMINNPV